MKEIIMDENKAIKIIKQEMGWERKSSTLRAFDTAIKALEEVQQYRKHGVTVENALNNMRDLTATENLLEEYRAIGTPEECRAAMEKQKPMAVAEKLDLSPIGAKIGRCPACLKRQLIDQTNTHCPKCGQKLKWEDEE